MLIDFRHWLGRSSRNQRSQSIQFIAEQLGRGPCLSEVVPQEFGLLVHAILPQREFHHAHSVFERPISFHHPHTRGVSTSSDEPVNPPEAKPKVGYVNARGTIYKMKGAEPLPVKTPAEQRRDTFRQHGFMALLSGAANRRHVERLDADRQKALTTIREARKVSGEVIADLGNGTVVKLSRGPGHRP